MHSEFVDALQHLAEAAHGRLACLHTLAMSPQCGLAVAHATSVSLASTVPPDCSVMTLFSIAAGGAHRAGGSGGQNRGGGDGCCAAQPGEAGSAGPRRPLGGQAAVAVPLRLGRQTRGSARCAARLSLATGLVLMAGAQLYTRRKDQPSVSQSGSATQ